MKTVLTHFWSILASLFYLALVFTGLLYLSMTGGIPHDFGFADFLLMSLAVWRLTRLFTYDAITKFIRDWFEGSAPYTLKGTLHTLLTCPWCTGLWFGATVVFFYYATPFAWPVILILAISALGSFFQVVSNAVGWTAELKKLEAQKTFDSMITTVQKPRTKKI